jgi:hypothetical protein
MIGEQSMNSRPKASVLDIVRARRARISSLRPPETDEVAWLSLRWKVAAQRRARSISAGDGDQRRDRSPPAPQRRRPGRSPAGRQRIAELIGDVGTGERYMARLLVGARLVEKRRLEKARCERPAARHFAPVSSSCHRRSRGDGRDRPALRRWLQRACRQRLEEVAKGSSTSTSQSTLE